MTTERDPEQSLIGTDALRLSLTSKRLTTNLLPFVREAWKIVEPDRAFVENWHIDELCKVLEEVTNGTTKRVVINVPPGTMKSLLVSVIWPCWMWARDPHLRILTAAYSDKRALDANLKARNIIKSPWFQKHFGLELVEDQNTKGRFDTKQGGWRIATSVGGEGTGLHPDFIIVDDAATATDAQSEVERATVNTWFDSTISTRGVSRGVAICVIGQRLHEEDLSGYLLKRGGWLRVCWPMRYEKQKLDAQGQASGNPPDARDHRASEGELLWPQLFPEAIVRQLELDLGPYGTAGQLQQHPAPEGGGLFKREWFQFVDADKLPKNILRRLRGYDTAATEGAGDWTRGIKIEEDADANFYLTSAVGGQLGPDGVDKLILSTAKMDGSDVAIREEKEGGASGKAVIGARTKLLRGYDYRGVQVSGSKVTRANPFRSQVEGGHVFLVRASWNEEYLNELCAFPTARHDDYVDASSCAFNAILLEPYREVAVREAVWG